MVQLIKTLWRRKRYWCLLGALALASPVEVTVAQSGTQLTDAAKIAIARRQERIAKADAAYARGTQLMAGQDYEGAVGEFKKSLDLLPDAPVVASRREQYKQGYADASVKLARQRAEEGRLSESIALVTSVLDPGMDPENIEAKQLYEDLNDPEIYNPAVTQEFIAKVKQVDQALKKAQSYIRIGDYDGAERSYNEVLNYDRYNSAARRGLEEVSKYRRQYFETAYDQNRTKMLTDISSMWESPIIRYGVGSEVAGPILVSGDEGIDAINEKLKRIVIPEVDFENTPLTTAIDFLRQKSIELDDQELNLGKKGVNIIIRAGGGGGAVAPAAPVGGTPIFDGAGGGAAAGFGGGGDDVLNRPITLRLTTVTLMEALRYTTEMARLKYKVEPSAVVIIPLTEQTDDLVTRTFRVPPSFLIPTDGGGAGGGGGADPFAALPADGGGGGGLKPLQSPREILESQGINFGPGSSVIYSKQTSQLIVRNTSSQMELIEAYIQSLIEGVSKQVFITTKFVEVRQDDNETFGFDWLLGQANLPGSSRTYVSGGTIGSTRSELDNLDYPFIAPNASIPTGGFPLTSGLRSGNLAANQNSIDTLLSGTIQGQSTLAPAVLALAGVFTDPEFQVVLRAISQHKGSDLLSAPSVVTRSGTRAKIEVIREFMYPSEYDPPEIPQEFGTGLTAAGGGGLGGSSVSSFPVTPANPAAFETRNVGVTMEVDPQIGPDGFTISLNLSPEVVEFEGFVNYGSPIFTGGVANGQPTQILLTANEIKMPIFATRRVSTAVDIWDGQTVAIGGLIREDVQHVQDKVPILGDIPVAGFFFRTESDVHTKRNLTVFVTATLIDPSGQPVNPRTGPVEPEVQ